MNTKTQIQKLLKARKRLEHKMKELDEKIGHILFRLDEEKRCMVRKCPLDTSESESDIRPQ